MIENIKKASLVIAEINVPTTNGYYELGFAEALEKEPIVVARLESELPLDTKDISTIFYEDQTRLEEPHGKIHGLTGRQASSEQ